MKRSLRRRIALLSLVSLVLLAASCREQTPPAPQNPQQQQAGADAPGGGGAPEWDSYVNNFLEAYFAARPDVAVLAGRHEFDGKLPDWSAEGLRREIARLRAERTRAAGFDAARLSDRQRFERDYLIALIDKDLFWMETADWPHRNPYYYADSIDPDVYVSREYAPLETRLRAYTAYARAIPTALAQIRGNLQLPLPRTYLRIGRTSIGGLAEFYEKEVPGVFAPVADAGLQSEFRAANEAAVKAVREFDTWLGAQEASATDNFAIGADKFREMLRATERVDIPLDELEQIGRRDLERNLAALRDECAKYAPGQAIAGCIAKSHAQKPEGSVVEAARRQLTDLKAFITEKNLVSIPGTEEAKVGEAPPYKRWNFAYINIPGPYEVGLPSTYYIAPPDASWSKEKRDAYVPGKSELLFTSVHEVWPGHFLQFLHANRSPSKFGQVFVGYAFAEGWAHYTEEMMWEAGLGAGDAEAHIGQLLEALLRNVRYLSAIGMHTKGMTVAESERMFREEGHQDAGNVEQQAVRGTFDPAYINYTMGKLMIMKLRADWTAERGGRAAWKDFHDQFLTYGGPPIPLVRAAMLGAADRGPLF